MKILATLFLGGLVATSQAAVFELYNCEDCNCTPTTTQNVFDNSCAKNSGIQSIRMTNNGGTNQRCVFYSQNSCSTSNTPTAEYCVAGPNSIALNACYNTYNSAGGANAISSYSDSYNCPS